jgi:hypothetical protein
VSTRVPLRLYPFEYVAHTASPPRGEVNVKKENTLSTQARMASWMRSVPRGDRRDSWTRSQQRSPQPAGARRGVRWSVSQQTSVFPPRRPLLVTSVDSSARPAPSHKLFSSIGCVSSGEWMPITRQANAQSVFTGERASASPISRSRVPSSPSLSSREGTATYEVTSPPVLSR